MSGPAGPPQRVHAAGTAPGGTLSSITVGVGSSGVGGVGGHVSAGQIAALVAAGAFVVLVLLMAVPLLKLGRTLDEATVAIRKAHEGSAPLLDDAQITLRQVNTQLDRVDGITSSARTVTSNVSVLTSLFTA